MTYLLLAIGIPLIAVSSVYVVWRSDFEPLVYLILAVFLIGAFQAAGIGESAVKLAAESMLLLMAAKILWRCNLTGATVTSVGGRWLLGLSVIGVVGGLSSGITTVGEYLFFIRDWIRLYLLSFVILNARTSDYQFSVLGLLVVFLLAFQVPISWIKLAIHGMDEFWIGTLHLNSASLSALLPAMVSSFLLAAFVYSGRGCYVALIAAAISFAIIGEKRVIVFLLPLVAALIFTVSRASAFRRTGAMASTRSFGQKLVVVAAVSLVAFYSGVRLIPSLNAEEQVGGSFSLQYLVSYTVAYNLREQQDANDQETVKRNADLQMGRFAILLGILQNLRTASPMEFLFGRGGGEANDSPWLRLNEDYLFSEFGLRGQWTAAGRILVECGVLGLLAVVGYLVSLLRFVVASIQVDREPSDNYLALGIIGAWFVILIDFFVYSTISIYHIQVPLLFFIALRISHSERAEETLSWLRSLPVPWRARLADQM